MHLIHNERIKLVATLLNALSIATLAAGCIIPMISFGYGLPAAPTGSGWGWVMVASLVGGSGLHVGGIWTLGGLR